MSEVNQPAAGKAWYSADRETFLGTSQDAVVATLASTATAQGWHVEPQQHQEWDASVGLLHAGIAPRNAPEIEILRQALEESGVGAYSSVILEYDFRRRGLRLDGVLLAPGVLVVIEFKRSKLTPADADQVTNYCVNLVEFHEETQRLCRDEGLVVVPILVQTKGSREKSTDMVEGFHEAPWTSILRNPIRCDGPGLGEGLRQALSLARGDVTPQRESWLASRFSPSSTILDAAISLFGNHDVAAIDGHAGSIEKIEATITEVASQIQEASQTRRNRIIFVSGAPGAGKTLVGLRLAFDPRFRGEAVFVTGNAPLVEVLTEALKRSYLSKAKAGAKISGYPKENAHQVIKNALFKIVKAHNFLGERGAKTTSSDGRIVIFDEAQRTYEKGRVVLGHALADHEADLILSSLERSYEGGCTVVALLGHKQDINRGERGAIAWVEAAERRGWDYSISDESLKLSEFEDPDHWSEHPLRRPLQSGHLSHSLRFYRNREIETWAHCVVEDEPEKAASLASVLAKEGHQVWLTRDIDAARAWAHDHRIGEERAGLIASGQGRRLAAEGLFVDLKPSIAQWMLAPSGDIRSSNMLETVQNQFQIQGLEIDYAIVCWDADLRRTESGWEAWKVRGAQWSRDNALEVAKNGYRVLLTRARKGMIVFVPEGDASGQDETRDPRFYDGIAAHLMACGAKLLK